MERGSTLALTPWRSTIALVDSDVHVCLYQEPTLCAECGGARVTKFVPKNAVRATEKVGRFGRTNDIVVDVSLAITTCANCDVFEPEEVPS